MLFSIFVSVQQVTITDSLWVRKYVHLQFSNTQEKLNDFTAQLLLTADDFSLYQQIGLI